MGFTDCFFLIVFFTTNILLPFVISFFILGKKGAWYKYFIVVSLLFYLVGGVFPILIVDYFETIGNEFKTLFNCEICGENYDLGFLIAIYQYGLMYYFLFPLFIGILFFGINYFKKKY